MVPLSKAQVGQLFQEAQTRLKSGDLTGAERLFQQVHDAAPNAAEPLFHLGRIARMSGDLDRARARFEHAHRAKPAEPAILQALAECQSIMGDTDSAAASHDTLIALQPRHPKPLADKALFLQQQGDFVAAERLFRKALRLSPGNGELYRMWLGGKKLAKGDPTIREMQKLFAYPGLNDAGRIHLGFALAKAMEDSGQFDKVFAYLRRANALQRKAFPYDPAARDAEVAAIMAASDQIGPPQDSDAAPIIVTGMPRSGTTLMEQILAAHDDVVAGGELAIGLKLAYAGFGVPPDIAPLEAIQAEKLTTFADGYARQTAMRVDVQGRRVTDKSIQNHLILGHLHRAMPRASLIVVRRDPRDVALSIYKNYFAGGTHRYSNDLGDIARYIKSFDRIVTFWKARVPVFEISYDALIGAPEEQARALVAAAGLDWQDQCLEFYKRGGAVKTLSIAQVRQPVYQSSGGAWQKYEKDMQPFIDAWDAEQWV
ncbi:sulfotransferase [Primorskyibacter aestuariivivens]|uniref:tetratricopeptide repeat-containing sulfotransferase family protein n=1 Tax=Primorskyibacter aestuariivivens TaxID=1888912 RepID=UPI0023003925|nr:tetratricopeptide repeat-containing sulfotransferase family protein [Primorskyibacter aestuariivivens]MDA7428343.1 sulfotransferase [Primorskyibacter aestuariivivens]